MDFKVDIKENYIYDLDQELLNVLLIDHSTGLNIIWGTDDYEERGCGYGFHDKITSELVTGTNGEVIKPRISKSEEERVNRVRNKAEVFTPAWICNKQNNLIDCAWFERKTSPFNKETEHGWKINTRSVSFSKKLKKTWKDYVSAARLEVSCGEAPYLCSRYDTVTGDAIPFMERIGLLDRKLRIVCENTDNKNDFLHYATIALQSTYGFDWQGDNVLLARENLLFTVIDAYKYKFQEDLSINHLVFFANIISWNIWQMDGIKYVVPDSCHEEANQLDLFGYAEKTPCPGCKYNDIKLHNGAYSIIMDWDNNRKIRYVDMIKEGVR